MAGRKHTPTQLKVLRNNPGKRKLNQNEPTPDAHIPEPPGFLKTHAIEEWRRITPELYRLGLLSEVDRTAIAAYCQVYRRWVEAEEMLERIPKPGQPPLEKPEQMLIARTTNGNVIQSPLVGVANTAALLLHKYLTEFGMTPAARARAVANRPDTDADNPWRKFGKRRFEK